MFLLQFNPYSFSLNDLNTASTLYWLLQFTFIHYIISVTVFCCFITHIYKYLISTTFSLLICFNFIPDNFIILKPIHCAGGSLLSLLHPLPKQFCFHQNCFTFSSPLFNLYCHFLFFSPFITHCFCCVNII